MLSDSTKDSIINFFRVSDVNKDGCLSREEVATIMRQIRGVSPTAGAIEKCFTALDIDRNGSVSEDEFCEVIMTWLQEVSDPHRKKRSSDEFLDSPSVLSRKKSVSDIANFFRQFSPINNFQDEQIMILTRSRVETDMQFLQREFKVLSPEEKSARHKDIRGIVGGSWNEIMAAIMALDWRTILNGVAMVNKLLSVVELFHSSQDKFDFSTIILTVFSKVSCVPKGGEYQVSMVQRLCGLLSPDVPAQLQAALYTPCLFALRNYITGPGVPCLQTVESGNPWHPGHAFTKQVVINEKLPHRLLALLQENTVVTSANCSFLRAAVLCVSAFAEDHSACLEIALKFGFRRVLTEILTDISNLQLYKPLARSIFGALSVLVGHTHVFEPGANSKVPKDMSLSAVDLFNMLVACHRMLDVLAEDREFDCLGVLNCAQVLKYTLPLVTSRDPLYKGILVSVMKLFKTSCDDSEERLCAAVALDGLLEQLMLSSRTMRNKSWREDGVTQTLVEQLQHSSGGRGAELGGACIGVFRTLLQPDIVDVLTLTANHVVITESIRLLSHVDCSMHAVTFLGQCLQHTVLSDVVKQLGVIDGMFALFFKFKQSVNVLSDILGVYVGPFYAIFTLSSISQCLNTVLHSKSARIAAEMFTPDHAQNIKQLHGVICEELRSGRLVESSDLHALCDELLLLLRNIVEVHMSASTVYANTLRDECGQLMEDWPERLNTAAVDGYMARVDMEICVVAYPQWPGDRAFGQLESEYTLIVPHSVSLELLQNYYVALLQTNVVINFLDAEGNLRPVPSQSELSEAIRHAATGESDRHVVEVYLTPALGVEPVYSDALGLMPKEVALRELQSFLALNNRRIHRQMMSDFYDLMLESNTADITMAQFVEALTGAKLKFPEQAAIDIFRAFDSDRNNRLSLNEIGLGFAMLADGNVDDKLFLMFQAYDTNRDNVLSKAELVYLLGAATGRSQAECVAYADRVGRHVDKNKDGVIDFEEFCAAVYNNQIPLGALWSDGVVMKAIEEAYPSPSPRRNSYTVPAVDFRGGKGSGGQQHPRSRSLYIPREFVSPMDPLSPAGRGRSQTTIAPRNSIHEWHKPSLIDPNRKTTWSQPQGNDQFRSPRGAQQHHQEARQPQPGRGGRNGGREGKGQHGYRPRR